MWSAASFGVKAQRPRLSFTCSQILNTSEQTSGLGNGVHPSKLAVRSLGYRVVPDVNCLLVGAANNLIFEVGFEDLDKEATGDNIVMSRLISQGHSASNASGDPLSSKGISPGACPARRRVSPTPLRPFQLAGPPPVCT